MSDFIIGDNLELESFFKQNTNALHEQNVVQRKNAITAIYQKVTDPNIAQSDSLSQQILLKYGKELLKAFSDQAEKVREMSIRSMNALLMNSEDNEPILSYVFSVLAERSNCQDLEGIQHLPEVMRPPPSQLPVRLIKFVEPSEEIRLLLVQLLHALMGKNDSDNLHEFVDDIVDIHRAFLMDPFAEVQKEACRSLTKFCKVNHQMLLHFTEKMGRAVLHPLVNKKSPIRTAALEALSAVLLCGVWKNNAFVFEILTGFKDPNSVPIKAFYEPMHNINYFATLIIDPKQQVRQAFIKEIGFWLRGLADRWDHHARLVPYLLSGLFDSDPQIQEAALQIIEDVGKEWEVEKEKDIKQIKQLGIEPAWTMDGRLANMPLPHPFKERPKLGMRGFIKNQVRKMWPALYKEIIDNNEENRLRASHLMTLGVIFSEDYMTQFLDNFIPNTILAIKKGETKIDKQIQDNLKQTYQFIGRFCDYTSYSFIIFSSMRGKFIRDEQYMRSATQALSWLCIGAIEATIDGIGNKAELLKNILDLLCERDMIESMSTINLQEILELLTTLVQCIESKASQEEKQVFYQNHQAQLNLIDNVLNYIQNFNGVLLNQPVSKQQTLIYSKRVLLQNFENSENELLFGDSKWKNLIGEIIHQLNAGSTQVYPITDILYDYLLRCELPEPIDFTLKLSQLILQSFDQKNAQIQLQIVLKLCAASGQWMDSLQQKQFNQKLLDLFLNTFCIIAGYLSLKREVGKQMSKDQLSLDYFSRTLISICNCYQKFYKKQYHQIVSTVAGFSNLFLPYPNAKNLQDCSKNQYLLPVLQTFIFDAFDQYGGEQRLDTRKNLFLLLSQLNQFVPVQETYVGDPYIIENYQKYIQHFLRLCIEEKDIQCSDLYRIMIKDLCKKTRNNFLQELEIAKYNNQLSRVELLYQIINS